MISYSGEYLVIRFSILLVTSSESTLNFPVAGKFLSSLDGRGCSLPRIILMVPITLLFIVASFTPVCGIFEKSWIWFPVFKELNAI